MIDAKKTESNNREILKNEIESSLARIATLILYINMIEENVILKLCLSFISL